MANMIPPRLGPVQLQILAPTGTTRVVQFKARTLTVGRSSDNQLLLDDKQVSSQHLRIEVLADQIWVTDLGSRNGTRLANEPLAPNQPTVWAAHQALHVGHHRLTLVRMPSSLEQTGHWQRQYWLAPIKRYANLFLMPNLRTWPTFLLTVLNQSQLRPWRPLLLSGGGLLIVLVWWWTIQVSSTQPASRANSAPLLPTFTSTPVGSKVLISAEPPQSTPTMLLITPMPAAPKMDPSTALGVSTLIPTYTPLPVIAATPVPLISNALIQAAQRSPASRSWDSRLDQLGVTLEEASALPGQLYWRLMDAQWQDEQEAHGKHHIYVNVLDQNGQPLVGQSVTITWTDGSSTGQTESKIAPDYGYNFQMFAPGYSYTASVDGLPSDSVHNLGMGDIAHREMKIHTTFLLTFQKTVK